jgi:ectoine hydroxylase-related dioxygenase (phytanoyl-CoA dioxygenase family)
MCRPAGTSVDEVCEIVLRDGAMILENVFSSEQVAAALGELMPYVDATESGRDDFAGRLTTRTGALVARSAASREMVLQPTVLGAARKFLAPYCERVQLHLSQVIRIKPGEEEQLIHRDRWAWGTYLDRVEPQLNSIWALTDFRKENGATQVVPGSVDWPDKRRPTEEEIRYAEMDAGSVLLYSGSVFHGGGANNSEADRIGVNLTYTLGWLRQEENQYLSCPPEVAQTLTPELQDLIGYTLGNYALGYFTPPLPPGEGPEAVGPEFALGRSSEAVLGTEELLEALTARVSEDGAPTRSGS